MCKIPIEVKQLAEKQALKSTMKHKIGAVIYNKKGIINSGYNRWLVVGGNFKNYCKSRYSIHSEQDALLGCDLRELWGSSIYVYRENGNLAKPCKHCESLLLSHGIKNIYWSG